MKNLKYFPFERNRYFYGKLLTVDDFQAEQKYMNDKRRLLNRFLYGCGVVSGMNVVRVDDTTVSVEMGLALDFSGREIVIDAPVIRRLSLIDGFEEASDENDRAGYLYLCVDYAETGKEPVHSVAGTGARSSEDTEYNKYAEGYRLYLTSREPDQEGFTAAHFYLDSQTIFWGKGIRIRQILPKYARSGQETVMKIVVENMGQQQPFAFSYDLQLSCLEKDGADRVTVSFDEKEHESSGRYEFSIPLKALNVKDISGSAAVVPGSFRLTVADQNIPAQAEGTSICAVASEDVRQQIMKNYYRSEMEEIVKNTYQQSIYLAKIRIIRAGTAYVIDEIENMPFGQYIFNNSLASAINDINTRAFDALEKEGGRPSDTAASQTLYPGGSSLTSASGSAVLDLVIGGVEGQKFFSGEITHGLGLGPVFVTLGQAVTLSDDSDRVFGDASVFMEDSSTTLADVSLAAKVNVKDGTFVIGAKINEPTSAKKLRVEWMAVRDMREQSLQPDMKRLMIRPEICDLEIRETCHFQAVFTNVTDQQVTWSVREPEGGTIDRNGMYTAPNVPGVYEVIAESTAYPELTASTFVVVRETKETGSRL